MSQFNPYYQWFGIAAEIRAPDHYQLLGLTTREASLAEIETAFQERQAILEAFEEGPHQEAAVRLMEETNEAFDTLSDPVLKSRYDQELPKQPSRHSPKKAKPTTATVSPLSGPTDLPMAESVQDESTRRQPPDSVASRRQKAPRKNHLVQVGMFFVPTLFLIVMISCFPGTTKNLMRNIRGLVYRDVPESDDKKGRPLPGSTNQPPDQIQPQRTRATAATLDKKTITGTVDLAKKTTSDNSPVKDVHKRSQPKASPGATVEPKDPESLRSNLPPRKVVEHYLREFLKLPAASPLEFLALATGEKERGKKYAIFEYATHLAFRDADLDALLACYDKWNSEFEISWEKEILERILRFDYRSPGSRYLLLNRITALIKKCRLELCIDKGIALCELAKGLLSNIPGIQADYFEIQKTIFIQSQNFDASETSGEKFFFEALFSDRPDLGSVNWEPAQSFSSRFAELEKLANGRLSRSVDRYEELLGKVKELANQLREKLSSKATAALLDERIFDLELATHQAIIHTGVDWTDRTNSRFQLSEVQVHRLSKIPPGPLTNGLPLLLEQESPFEPRQKINGLEFCGKVSRLYVQCENSNYLLDSLTRKMVKHPANSAEDSHLLSHPTNYVTIHFKHPKVTWTDVVDGKQLTESLQLPAPPTGKEPLAPASRFRPVAVINARNDIVTLHGSNLVQVDFPSSREPKLQQPFPAGISQPIGIVSNARNLIAVIGNSEIVILENRNEKRRVKISNPVRDFIFSRTRGVYYLATKGSLVQLGEASPVQMKFPGIVRLEELDENHLLVARQFGDSFYSLQVLSLKQTPPRILQRIVVESPEFRISNDRKQVAVLSKDHVRLFSVSKFKNRP
ncbi:MAG: hypothetical protein VX768_06270 [Planctomycetota bacterium]|nr:hypothetical protein [Planctomycetota bacterium]